MTLAVLELNDQSLLIQAEGGPLHAEPGFARLTHDGVETGEAALATAWSEPQHSYNQYWGQLNQTPMAASQKFARHHADIAFAQLNHLWQGAASPESLILLVPGSFSDERLSLLLGMVAALPCEALAVIDSALAACFQAGQETLFVDMQLHQTVLSVCRPGNNGISIIEQEVFPDLGMMQILNSAARHISNMLIDSVRYDPLHASGSEQDIYDHLPEWLTRLRWESEVPVALQTQQGEMPFILRNDRLKKLLTERMANIRSFLARYPACHTVLSHASSLLAGLSDEFSEAEVAGHAAAVENTLSQHPLILGQTDGLIRIQSLGREAGKSPSVDDSDHLATHVLHGDRALSLRKPVSIRVDGENIEIASEVDTSAALTVVLRNRSLEAVHLASGMEASVPENCRPGESIMVAGHHLRLIEVPDG